MTVDDLVAAARALPARTPVVFATSDGPIGKGYHVTELKLARIVSIDCAARVDAWTEATLQLLDGQSDSHMALAKFTGILSQSAERVVGVGDAPLRVEFGYGNAGLQLFDMAPPQFVDGVFMLQLIPLTAHCKPGRDQAQRGTSTDCCKRRESACCG